MHLKHHHLRHAHLLLRHQKYEQDHQYVARLMLASHVYAVRPLVAYSRKAMPNHLHPVPHPLLGGACAAACACVHVLYPLLLHLRRQ